MTIFVESAESAIELAGKNILPPNEASPPTKIRLLKLASPTRLDVPATYKREFSEVSPLAKSRPFNEISSETIN